jgi:hypothetical protein
MKTFKLLPTVTIALFTILFSACKKDKDAEPKPTCRIITATPSSASSDPFNITYNSDGKPATVSSGNDVTTFAYSGSTAIATTNTSGVFSSKQIITLNSNGLASNVRTEHDLAGTNWNNSAFEYNGTELIKATYTSSGGGTPSVSIVTWNDGNLVSVSSGSSTTTLDYYTDKPAQTGDYLYLAQLVQGYQIYKTKNLLKSILSGTDITGFDYNFGSDGYISSLTASGSSAITYTYQYQCN